MTACDICKQALTEDVVLCDGCREAITRLRMICNRQPELLGGAALRYTLESESGAAAAA